MSYVSIACNMTEKMPMIPFWYLSVQHCSSSWVPTGVFLMDWYRKITELCKFGACTQFYLDS